jgi:hypothetical protein
MVVASAVEHTPGQIAPGTVLKVVRSALWQKHEKYVCMVVAGIRGGMQLASASVNWLQLLAHAGRPLKLMRPWPRTTADEARRTRSERMVADGRWDGNGSE